HLGSDLSRQCRTFAWESSGAGSRLVRDQEVGGSNPLAPTNSFNNLQGLDDQTAHPTAHPVPKLLLRVRAPILRPWEKNAATHLPPAPPPLEEPASSRPSLAPIIDINVRHLGRKPQPPTLIGATAPEGWIKKVDRPREGKVWVGYFHLYVADFFGRPVRKK